MALEGTFLEQKKHNGEQVSFWSLKCEAFISVQFSVIMKILVFILEELAMLSPSLEKRHWIKENQEEAGL